jgi:two-component system cell cycle sensor histidine kinase/response regulator CckA
MPKTPHEKSSSAASPADSSVQRLTELITRSQRGYRELIDHLDQALFTLSLQGEIRVANLRLSQILGASFQDLIGRKLTDFVESPSPAEFERAVPNLLNGGTWSGTVPVRLKRDQEIHYFLCWLQAVEDEDRSMSVIGWARDVTALHESEIRFTELFESLREGILFSTPEGRILDANPALVHMLGYDSKEELLRHNFAELYDKPEARQKIIRLLEDTGSIQNTELVLRRKDGKKVYCLTSGFAIRDASGRPVRLQGTLVDVTERMEIERKLHREQEFGRQLIECFPDMIAVMDREGRFTYVSERSREVLGVSPAEYLGRHIGSSTHPDDRDELLKMVQDIVSGRSDHAQIESRVRRGDGVWRTLRTSASPMFDEDGRITGVVASVRDVTEANLAEQQNVQKEKFAAMGQMMAGAAHELNNPLTAILGVSDLLRERATDDTSKRQIDLVLQQARRAAGIVQNLLAFSRPAMQGRMKLRLGEVLRDVLRAQRAALTAKNISVKFDPPGEVLPVEGDRRLLSQIFSNLVINSEQAISSAHDRGEIEVSVRDLEGRVCVTIADDGPGIPPENISKIFDPFFTTKRPGGGSGLGLTICMAVVKDHGGTIEVSSEPAVGTSFRVFLPSVLDRTKIAEPVLRTAKATPAGSEILEGRTVLIVDDEESIREIVREGLSARGMKVHTVGSSEEAMTYLEANPCDVVICDYNLPGMSGEIVFERFTSDRRAAQLSRFVFMTGDLVDSENFDRLRRKRASVLQKPFHIGALATLLADLLQPQPSQAS